MERAEFIEGRKSAPVHLGRVLVLGLGKSGMSVVRYCAGLLGGRVSDLYVAAGGETEVSRRFLADAGIDPSHIAFGDDGVSQLMRSRGIERFDLCIASPGIPYFERLYVEGAANSAELISEVEFSWRESRTESAWVAITGTNGKTTTTACCAELLAKAGLRASAVGNIGTVCLDAVLADETDAYVAEVSSYQLASTARFAPDVAVVLNITPDHLHWHRTFEAYRDAKFKLLDNLASSDGAVAVLDAANDVVREKVRELARQSEEERGFSYIPLGTSEGVRGDMRRRCGSRDAAFVAEDGMLTVAFKGVETPICRVDELLVKGGHNVGNALAAASAAVALGCDGARIGEALKAFAPLAHRIEPCGTIAGAICYNDSKATNVDASVKAVASFAPVRPIVLLGGDDKGTDLSELVSAVHAHARCAVLFGAAADRFERAFSQSSDAAPERFEVKRARGLESALDAALSVAGQGDVILLSPACASFDEFGSFEERGDAFKKMVAARAARA